MRKTDYEEVNEKIAKAIELMEEAKEIVRVAKSKLQVSAKEESVIVDGFGMAESIAGVGSSITLEVWHKGTKKVLFQDLLAMAQKNDH